MITNWGSTFPQTGEMPGPTEQKERKTIWEEGELAAAFNLVDEEGNLNFTLLTCNLKIIYLSCHIFIWKLKMTLLDFSTFLNKQFLGLK